MSIGYKFKTPATLFIMLGVVACGAVQDRSVSKPTADALDGIDTALDKIATDSIKAQVSAPTPLSVPRNATWLSNNVVAAYDDLPASLAIKAISGDRPVRFTFPVTHDPLVKNTASSTTIKDHLDSIMNQSNWIYAIENGALTINDIETRTFQVALQPGTKSATVGFRNLGSSLSDGGSSDNSLELTLNPYDGNILEMVRATLGLNSSTSGDEVYQDAAVEFIDGSATTAVAQSLVSTANSVGAPAVDPRTSVAILPSGNIMVVTAKPDRMRVVEMIIDNINEASSTLVKLDLTLYDVDVTNSETRSLDLSASAVTSANDLVGLAVTPSVGAINSGLASFEIVGSQFSGTRAVFNWLKTMGDTSVVLSDEVTVLNNQVGSVGDTQTKQYVSSVTDGSTSTDLETVAPTIEKDELRTGIEVHVQPTVVNGRIIVRLSLSRSALIDEEAYSFADGAIAGTNLTTDDYNRVVTIELRDGVTRLITSQTSQESISSRGRTWLPWAGDSVASSLKERQTVMLMTASILKW